MGSSRAVRLLRLAATALAAHGVLLALAAAVKPYFPEAFEFAGVLIFWVLVVPALVIASPFTALFWKLGLMHAPGWFAWPKPLGLVLAYVAWIVALAGLSWALQVHGRRSAPPPGRA
jgi:hypothetical protein